MPNSTPLLLILLVLAGCQSATRGPISAAELSDEYEISSGEVEKKYNGREIVVRGYVLLPATMPQPGDDQGSILVGDRERHLAHPGRCWFSKDQSAAFAQITGGQHVTVKGVFSGENGANLRFCSLANIETGQ